MAIKAKETAKEKRINKTNKHEKNDNIGKKRSTSPIRQPEKYSSDQYESHEEYHSEYDSDSLSETSNWDTEDKPAKKYKSVISEQKKHLNSRGNHTTHMTKPPNAKRVKKDQKQRSYSPERQIHRNSQRNTERSHSPERENSRNNKQAA